MSHSTHHAHNHAGEGIRSPNAAFIIGIALNAVYVAIEIVFGLVYKSMGLAFRCGRNLSDVASLIIAMVAFRLMSQSPTSGIPTATRNLPFQASFINALLLYIAVGAILVESVEKLLHPEAVDGDAIAWWPLPA